MVTGLNPLRNAACTSSLHFKPGLTVVSGASKYAPADSETPLSRPSRSTTASEPSTGHETCLRRRRCTITGTIAENTAVLFLGVFYVSRSAHTNKVPPPHGSRAHAEVTTTSTGRLATRHQSHWEAHDCKPRWHFFVSDLVHIYQRRKCSLHAYAPRLT